MMRLAAVLLLSALFGYQEKTEYLNAYGKLGIYLCEQRLSLGDWCRKNGLPREAKIHFQFIADKIPSPNPYRGAALNRLQGSWKKDPNTATPEKRAEYRKRLLAYFQGVGDRCWTVYQAAKKARLKPEAAEALEKTVQFYIDHEAARKERGEEKVEGFGWLPAAEAELARGAVDWKDDRSAQDKDHTTWANSWVVQSPRFIVRTTHPFKKAVEALELLEKLHDAFYGAMAGRMKAPDRRMGLYLFRLDIEAEKVREKLGGGHVPVGGSFFHAGSNVAYIRWWDDSTLLHEATHQLAHNGMDIPMLSYLQQGDVGSDSPDNYWVMEGIAVYYGTIRWTGKTPEFRKAQGISKLTIPPLKEFLGFNFAQFQADTIQHYSSAYGLTLYLMEGREGKHREKFLDFVRDFYNGSSSIETFEKCLGVKLPDLETDFRAWLAEQ